jgi:hypothetical protein
MKKVISVYVTLFFLALISCKAEKKEATQATQMKDVMAIHDEVMPKMGEMGKLVAELNAKVDTTAVGMQYDSAKKELQTAHQSMMDWMHGFGDRFDSDEILNGKELSPEKQQWLEEEEAKIKAVREQCFTSIEKAEKLLGK